MLTASGASRSSVRFSTAPNDAAPSDWPTKRRNMQDEVAAPRWCHGTAAWIDTMNVVLHSPMPMPISSEPALAQPRRAPASA